MNRSSVDPDSNPSGGDLTRILAAHRDSPAAGTNEILPVVYSELRRLASSRLAREGRAHTLQPTALVHEAYLRLLSGSAGWENRRHFFGAAAEAMRRILIDHARARSRRDRTPTARGAGAPLDGASEDPAQHYCDLIALDTALSKLHEVDAPKAKLVELRYFAGLPLPEVAELLGLSLRTAERQWAYTRAWLHREIDGDGRGSRKEGGP